MFFRQVIVQNFRNIELIRLDFDERRQFFYGANGQGKTNLLECLGYLTALRSFRTADNGLLVRSGQPEAAVAYTVEHEVYGESRLTLRIAPDGNRVVHWDGGKVGRLADILGRFPAVVFSTGDLQFIRGAPAVRRRWMDLILSTTDAAYFQALQQYHRTLSARNALLKRRAGEAELSAFERELAGPAAAVIAGRRDGTEALQPLLVESYRQLAGDGERAAFSYHASAGAGATAGDLLERWKGSREKDLQFGATQTGPHRDDFSLSLDGRSAGRYGSEGQQRSLVIALRLAQSHYFRGKTGLLPVMLLDDVVGELDADRRERFWGLVGGEAQVFASGTGRPALPAEAWRFVRMESGAVASTDPESAVGSGA